MVFAVWQVLWQGQLTRSAIVSPPSSGSASPPGTTGTSLIPKVGAVVRGPRGGDYLLLQRLNSLPGTFAPSAIEMPDAHAIQLFGHVSAQGSDRWLIAVPAADAANNLALPNSNMTATAPPPSVAPGARLGLPSPFESEVESDTEGEDEQLTLSRATYRLRRRVYGARGCNHARDCLSHQVDCLPHQANPLATCGVQCAPTILTAFRSS